MSEENKVKLQHYVPRVYLKNFSSYNGKEYYIWVFDKETDKIFQTNIKDIAFEEEFYDKINEDQITEQKLRELETNFGIAIEKLISIKDIDKLDKKYKQIISEFIASQMIRTKELRIELEEIPKALLEKWGHQMIDSLKEEVENSTKPESLRNLHRKIVLEDYTLYSKIFSKMKWILLINKSKFSFWTSDNPVVKYNSINHFPYGNLGLTKIGIEVHFPINQKLCLLLCDPISFQLEPNKKVTKDYRHIIRERDLQVRDSTRFVFSNENKFAFARMMLRENKELKNPDRKRVKVN